MPYFSICRKKKKSRDPDSPPAAHNQDDADADGTMEVSVGGGANQVISVLVLLILSN